MTMTRVESSPKKWTPKLGMVLEVVLAVLKTISEVIKTSYRKIFPADGKDLQGQVVLVTGAGHGIGQQLALQFAKSGCLVVCVDKDASTNARTVDDINSKEPELAARAYQCDVSDYQQVLSLADQVLKDVGQVDILVNNAGIMPVQPIVNAKPHQVVDVINVNLMAHFWTVLAFLPGMVKRNEGHIVAISSMAGLCGLANKVPYSASKFAVAGLMDALAEELRLDAHNVKVTCVHPYFIHTRPDLPEQLDLRIPELSPEVAAADIIDAVRHDVLTLTVPRNLLFWINVMRTLPQDARQAWRDVFYTRVTPSDPTPPVPSDASRLVHPDCTVWPC